MIFTKLQETTSLESRFLNGMTLILNKHTSGLII